MTYPNLKAEMARNGMTTQDVADAAGVSRKTVSNWLSSSGRPDIEQAKKIRRELFPSCELGYLFDN